MERVLTFIKRYIGSFRKTVGEILYGMTVYEIEREIKRERGNLNNFLMLVIFGDMVGLPILPPYYSLKLLPFIIPGIDQWKKSILRERDITDIVAGDL